MPKYTLNTGSLRNFTATEIAKTVISEVAITIQHYAIQVGPRAEIRRLSLLVYPEYRGQAGAPPVSDARAVDKRDNGLVMVLLEPRAQSQNVGGMRAKHQAFDDA